MGSTHTIHNIKIKYNMIAKLIVKNTSVFAFTKADGLCPPCSNKYKICKYVAAVETSDLTEFTGIEADMNGDGVNELYTISTAPQNVGDIISFIKETYLSGRFLVEQGDIQVVHDTNTNQLTVSLMAAFDGQEGVPLAIVTATGSGSFEKRCKLATLCTYCFYTTDGSGILTYGDINILPYSSVQEGFPQLPVTNDAAGATALQTILAAAFDFRFLNEVAATVQVVYDADANTLIACFKGSNDMPVTYNGVAVKKCFCVQEYVVA